MKNIILILSLLLSITATAQSRKTVTIGGVGGSGGGTTYTGAAPIVVTGSVISADTAKAQGKLATFNGIGFIYQSS